MRASRSFVVGDALVHAVVPRTAHQLGHAGCAGAGVALLLHAVLGAWEASRTTTAATVEGGVKAPFAAALPNLHVCGTGAAATLELSLLLRLRGLLLVLLQSLQVVDLDAAQLVELQAAVLPGFADVIRRQSRGHVLCEGSRKAQEHEQRSEGHGR